MTILGNPVSGSPGASSANVDRLEAGGPYTAAANATMNSISVYANAVSGTVNLTMGVYRSDGTLLATSAEFAIGTTPTTYTASISGAITGGHDYYLALAVGGDISLFYEIDPPDGKYNTAITYVGGTLPSTLPSMTNFGANLQRFFSLDVTDGGAGEGGGGGGGGGGGIVTFNPPLGGGFNRGINGGMQG